MKFKKTAVLVAAVGMVSVAGPSWAAVHGVSIGGSTASGTHTFSAVSAGSINFVANGPSGPVAMGCSHVNVGGSIQSGTAVSDPIASLTSSAWGKAANASGFCTGPLGIDMNVVPDHSPAWTLSVTSGATSGVDTAVQGVIENVDAYVFAKGAEADCSFRVTGSAHGTFNESTQVLTVNETHGHLTLSGITTGQNDCFGLVEDLNTADFTGSFNISTSGGAVNILS